MIKPVSRIFRNSLLIFTFFCGAGQVASVCAKGLPGEYLLTQRWQYLFSSRSAITNPAFINEENYFAGKYAFSSIMNEFTLHELGVVYPIGLYQSFGVSWLMQGTRGKVLVTGPDLSPIPGQDSLSSSQSFFVLTYANNLWKGLTLGANINGAFNTILNSGTQIGFGIDAGLSYNLLNNPVVGNHLIGISLQNIFVTLKEQYSRGLRVSLNSTYWERQIETGFDFTLKDIGTPASDFLASMSPQLEWDFNAKIGFWILRMANLYGLVGFTEGGMEFWGFAGGLNMPFINNGRDISFLYQFLSLTESEVSTHSLYVRSDFGKHREEIFARKMAKMANVAPNDLYLKAIELYNAGNYWDAFFLFSQLFVEYPDFFKNDWVSFFLGSCQENLDMRSTAVEAYQKSKSQFARSAAVPFSDLGIMRVHYRNGDYSGVSNQFNELNKLGVPDSIKFHGYYLMGQAELKEGNHSKAKQLFDLIPDTHPDYVFAQHSIAISNAVNGDIEGAVSNLENCIQAQVSTNSQKEIVNRSYVFLGYVFYEELTKQEGPMAKAVTALRSVPKTSMYYPDALLGLAWTGLKARQWADCISAGSQLASIAQSPVLKAEGTLLQAYAYMMQKNYPTAANLLSSASNDLENFQAPSSSELNSKQQDYERIRADYTEVARKAYDLGTARQSSIVVKQIDSLHTHQKDIKTKIDDFMKFVDTYDRASFFSRNLDQVSEDVDYALAKAQKLAGQSKQADQIQQFKEKESDLDEQLRKLQEQLEQQEAQ